MIQTAHMHLVRLLTYIHAYIHSIQSQTNNRWSCTDNDPPCSNKAHLQTYAEPRSLPALGTSCQKSAVLRHLPFHKNQRKQPDWRSAFWSALGRPPFMHPKLWAPRQLYRSVPSSASLKCAVFMYNKQPSWNATCASPCIAHGLPLLAYALLMWCFSRMFCCMKPDGSKGPLGLPDMELRHLTHSQCLAAAQVLSSVLWVTLHTAQYATCWVSKLAHANLVGNSLMLPWNDDRISLWHTTPAAWVDPRCLGLHCTSTRRAIMWPCLYCAMRHGSLLPKTGCAPIHFQPLPSRAALILWYV